MLERVLLSLLTINSIRIPDPSVIICIFADAFIFNRESIIGSFSLGWVLAILEVFFPFVVKVQYSLILALQRVCRKE